ncbi:sugar ABC transporter substrate-binding protein [Amycolatopsis pithecellobii]|uniref:Substrate-binding domain-containing protein n=1 Tax=Amycolatopsis pithecellobii TaxID=664692 RepID=A0A6N7Z2T4_9PSEU|nr:sugar ABC transporter substrate-binding protein [Amycolatopsis pithecellobii]MTD54290.1 substrate-binding domain-containing protein [Amycolatopsis pithecellobii]
MMMKLACVGYMAVLAALMSAITACGSSGSAADTAATASGSSSAATQHGNKIAYLQPLVDPSVQSVTLGMQCAAKKDGDTIVSLNAGFDQGKQINQFDTALTQGAKGIIANPVNQQAMYPSYAKAHGEGVPVIDYAGPNASPPNATNVGEDPSAVAQATVDAIMKAIPSGAKAIMIGGPPAVAGVTPRENAFRAAAGKAGIQILGEEDSLTLAATDVQAKTSSLLLKYPQANIIWGITGATASSAAQAANAQGDAVGTKVFTVGVGASPDVAADVRAGTLSIMVDNKSYEWGEALVGLMDQAIAGQTITNPTLSYTSYTKADINSWVPPTARCTS